MSTIAEGIILHQKNLPARDPVTLKLAKPPLVLLTKEANDKVLYDVLIYVCIMTYTIYACYLY